MTDAPPTLDFSDQPFALKRCAVCGYDLTGRATQRHCPECGAKYDLLTLQVWGNVNKSSFLSFLGSVLGLNAAVLVIIEFLYPYGRTAAITGLVLLVIAGGLSAVLRRHVYKLRYGTSDGRGQLIASRSGAAVRNGYGRPRSPERSTSSFVPPQKMPKY